MIIETVRAHAFGPLVEETLDFADGLTVVYGGNESAKSTWHAAIYAALCGRRRGKGTPSAEEQRFIDLHKPWDRSDWVVSAVVRLDDRRRIEIRQELDDRVACDAVDLDLGRDCSAEIIHDGTPDAARWLGLDRSTFLGTACIAQAQILDVLRHAGGLQAHVQRAASTAGAADQTATMAIGRIDKFRADHVGTERSRTKPLHRAVERTRRARANLDLASADHAEHDRRLTEANRLRALADGTDREVRQHEAAHAGHLARQIRSRADLAAELDVRVGAVTRAPVGQDVAGQVAEALARWRVRPAAPAVAGRPADAADVTDEQLRELARDLQHGSSAEPAVADRLVRARARLTAGARRRARGRRVIAAGVVPVLAAATVLAVGARLPELRPAPIAAAALAAAGLLVIVAGWWLARRAGDVAAARSDVAAAELDAAAYERSAEQSLARRDAAVARCEAAGLPAHPVALRALADQRAESDAFARRDEQWGRESLRAAADQVLRCARDIGVEAETAEVAVEGLVRWQVGHAADVARLERAREESGRLQALLGEGTLVDLQQQAEAAEEHAHRLLADVTTVDDVELIDVDALRGLRSTAREAAEAARVAEVTLAECAARATPVGEAEEDIARAEGELARLRDLDATLELTRGFLVRAQERAHRTIAPVLASTVRRLLPEATGGRYTEVTVDPERLQVHVRGPAGRWRDAALLSYGTAEQIYLMLRIALAEHLARDETACPLILDDVTVHADGDRVIRILDLLLKASADRQIVLFTSQEQVRGWARERLDGTRDALRELAQVAVV